MVRDIETALHEWETDPTIEMILLDGAGERGFCAGGDLHSIYRGIQTDRTIVRQLWQEEYCLDAHLARYPHVVVSLMDGLVMGAGLGLSAHEGVRIVTERSRLAMPETAIGLAPDVGGAYLLAQAPGELGTHLALTGTRIGPHTALACGFADYLVPSEMLPQLTHDVRTGGLAALHPWLEQAASDTSYFSDTVRDESDWIDSCYAWDEVETILALLRQRREPHAQRATHALDVASPRALKVTLRALRNAQTMTNLEECLIQDYRVSSRCLEQPDFAEGIRAAVIDKDHSPRWVPAYLGDVDSEMVMRHFQPLGRQDLPLRTARRTRIHPREKQQSN